MLLFFFHVYTYWQYAAGETVAYVPGNRVCGVLGFKIQSPPLYKAIAGECLTHGGVNLTRMTQCCCNWFIAFFFVNIANMTLHYETRNVPIGTRMPPLAAKASEGSFDIGEWVIEGNNLDLGVKRGWGRMIRRHEPNMKRFHEEKQKLQQTGETWSQLLNQRYKWTTLTLGLGEGGGTSCAGWSRIMIRHEPNMKRFHEGKQVIADRRKLGRNYWIKDISERP